MLLVHPDGIGMARPQMSNDHMDIQIALKEFAGPAATRNPNILIKADAAHQIRNAARGLGWHYEPSLANWNQTVMRLGLEQQDNDWVQTGGTAHPHRMRPANLC